MLVGLGVDITEIERMRAALTRRPRLKERLFSEDERWYCEHKAHPETHYALRFAAKEAVLKALGTGFAGMAFRDVEVAHDERGRPIPKLSGAAAKRADELGIIEIHLSLSYTHTTAVASAVAITAEARPKKEKPVDVREKLTREFRELRGVLDELESGLAEEPDSDSDVSGDDVAA
ncbi:MAG: holo-ACP synthase [Actinomycetes bacterium]|jgi:holo-[acyl-carrier protein] synthase|nr:holo-ACP synthase [Actinomycetes bacterium]